MSSAHAAGKVVGVGYGSLGKCRWIEEMRDRHLTESIDDGKSDERRECAVGEVL